MGLLTFAYPATRTDLEQATETCSAASASSRPPNSRSRRAPGSPPRCRRTTGSQQLYHPWTSYVIVPLFALANAGIVLSGAFLARAYTSPVTLGILIGYVVGQAARA